MDIILIYVYKSKYCSDPILTSPSTCIGTQVGLPTTVTLTVINSCGISSNISSIAVQSFSGIVQGPLVLITPNKTVYAMNITYTPLASQVGLQILCAAALDSTSTPSKQYCITFIVGSSTTTSSCANATTTTLSIQTTSTRTVTNTTTSNNSSNYTETVQTSETSTMYDAQISTYIEITSIGMETSSSLISTQIFQTTADETTSETTTASKSNTYDWPLIGSLITLFSLLALIGSCCLCYHFLWSPGAAARRRLQQQQQQQQQKGQYRLQHQPVSKIGTDPTKICRPPKPYQIFDVDVESTAYSNNNKDNHSRLETTSTILTNSIPNNRSISAKTKENSKETDSSFNTNRTKSTITVTRISNIERRKSISNERKRRQSNFSNVRISRIKK